MLPLNKGSGHLDIIYIMSYYTMTSFQTPLNSSANPTAQGDMTYQGFYDLMSYIVYKGYYP